MKLYLIIALIYALSLKSVSVMAEKRPKVLVTHPRIPEVGFSILRKGCDVFQTSDKPSKEEVLRMVAGMDGILWVTHHKLDAEVLDAAGPQLKSISTMSAGLDQVDIAEVKRRNISIGYTPFILNDAVADLAIGLMIAASRKFHEGQLLIANNEWPKQSDLLGRDIKSSVIGIVGFGGIGQTIAKRMQGFDVGRIIYSGHKPKPDEIETKLNAKFVSFDDLITTSDFVFIACPLTVETRNMFNKTVFEKMKKNSVLINIARGEIVNQNDLYDALFNNVILAAGIDVMTPEPLPKDDKLLTLKNIFVTPHLGSATDRTRHDMANIAALNILMGIAGEPMLSPVP